MSRREKLVTLRDQVAREILECVRADAAAAPWPLQGLLLELANNLFSAELHVGEVWRRLRQKDHSLSSRFAGRFGETPKAYLEQRRMAVAAKLLEHPELRISIEEVGRAVGYSELRTFQRCFQRHYGVGPGAYRQPGAARAVVPGRGLSALSFAELEARLRTAVEQLAPGCVCERWTDILEGAVVFSTPALFEQMLALSRELGRHDRSLGIRLAEKAVASLDQLRGRLPERELAALEARGWAWVGNARRRAHDLWAAEEAFSKARARLRLAGSTEAAGEVIYLEVNLRIAQRRLAEALEITEQRVVLYRQDRATKRLAEALLDRGTILRLLGEAARAVPSLEEARQLVDSRCEPLFALATLQILAVAQMQTGAVEKARQLLPDIEALGRSLENPQAATQIAWLEGRIHAAQGELDMAAEVLWKVREAFSNRGDDGNEAMVMLDLATVELSRNQAVVAAKLAAEALAVLERIDVDREVTCALLVMREALAANGLTTAILGELRRQLELGCC